MERVYQYSSDGTGNAEWPFDSPQYLILNIAVGGARQSSSTSIILPMTSGTEPLPPRPCENQKRTDPISASLRGRDQRACLRASPRQQTTA
jgi:hypothetical protein